MTRARAVLASLLVMGVAAIGFILHSRSDDQGPPDPCLLLRPADIEKAIGIPISEEVSWTDDGGRECEWLYPDPSPLFRDPLLANARIRVQSRRGREFYIPDAIPEAFRPIAGVGDRAHMTSWYSTDGVSRGLYVIQGEDVFYFDDDTETAVELAKLLVSRLKTTAGP